MTRSCHSPLLAAGLALEAATLAAIAAALILAPTRFAADVPGVATPYPPDLHLLRDVGIAYAVFAAIALRALAVPTTAPLGTIAIAAYLDAHLALHLVTDARQIEDVLPAAPLAILATAVALVTAARHSSRSRARSARLRPGPQR